MVLSLLETNYLYRSEISGIKPEHLMNAMPLKQVQDMVQQILYSGEAISRARSTEGRAKLLVGHTLDRILQCLEMEYPAHLIRSLSIFFLFRIVTNVMCSLTSLHWLFIEFDFVCF